MINKDWLKPIEEIKCPCIKPDGSVSTKLCPHGVKFEYNHIMTNERCRLCELETVRLQEAEHIYKKIEEMYSAGTLDGKWVCVKPDTEVTASDILSAIKGE